MDELKLEEIVKLAEKVKDWKRRKGSYIGKIPDSKITLKLREYEREDDVYGEEQTFYYAEISLFHGNREVFSYNACFDDFKPYTLISRLHKEIEKQWKEQNDPAFIEIKKLLEK